MLRPVQALVALAALLPAVSALALTPAQLCEKKASTAARSCVKSVAAYQLKCYQTTGAKCAANDTKVAAALAKLETQVLAACPDAAAVQGAGYGTLLTPAALVDRLQDACTWQPASLAARSFAGPHAEARNAATADDQKCLDYAFKQGRALIDYGVKQYGACITRSHAGGTCTPADVTAKVAAREASLAAKIAAKCPTLADLVNIDATEFAKRTSAQSRCLVALAHGATTPLTLDCGPRAAAPVPALATNTQVILPNAVWGTKCGNGSDYAFWVRLPPAGQPVNRVVFYMQGGGGCYDGPDCAATNPALFDAQDDTMGGGGILSNSATTNPFRFWTKVYLPYCTQDLHIGNGVTNAFTEITVERYGARNVRAALQYVRDVLWAQMNATDAEGYRNDRMTMVFTGGSAGGYGAMYNYHYVLDDLAWPHTTVLPDAAAGMDNGTLGVKTLGSLAILPTAPGWDTKPVMPPYCHTADCAEIMNTLVLATAPRLLGVPEQQILHLTNQVDNVQRDTTLFTDTPTWTNTLRSRYCGTQGIPGVHAFLRASSTSIHTQLGASGNWDNAIIGGTRLRDWVGGAMSSPGSVVDKVALGTLETDFPEPNDIDPFPCTVGSPSGAFLSLD